MNTPQFDWVRSRLPNKAEPVPPIFQPEVGAEAVFYAAHNDVGRELLVGWPTVKAVFGNKLVPAYIDRRLAVDGYEMQQTAEPSDATRTDNLFAPAPGDWAAHGRFELLLAGAAVPGLTPGSLPRLHIGKGRTPNEDLADAAR